MLIDSVYSIHPLCSPKQAYMRLDPYRKNNIYVFIDYTQKEVINNITGSFFRDFTERFVAAVDLTKVCIACQ